MLLPHVSVVVIVAIADDILVYLTFSHRHRQKLKCAHRQVSEIFFRCEVLVIYACHSRSWLPKTKMSKSVSIDDDAMRPGLIVATRSNISVIGARLAFLSTAPKTEVYTAVVVGRFPSRHFGHFIPSIFVLGDWEPIPKIYIPGSRWQFFRRQRS